MSHGPGCTNPAHDHYEYGRPMVCLDCGQPAHYDEAIGSYRHDNPDTPPCFLIRYRTGEP